jgi:hypothetical protein
MGKTDGNTKLQYSNIREQGTPKMLNPGWALGPIEWVIRDLAVESAPSSSSPGSAA